MSRKKLALYARAVRKLAGQEYDLCFDITKFVDITLPKLDPGFSLQICDKSEMGECHGLTYPDRNEMKLREDVYLRALMGNGRDRLTISHELFHLLQHTKENISYARSGAKIPIYRSPEWQADAFGGELLVPRYLVKGMSLDDIVRKCMVSYSAARCQLNKMYP
ncbi:MAG: ImmA/IrrE family metallo-endopeptidase [Lachnospiraceae bacterium]|nr:ImmA/IrrE family metallo-endopeptidase [Lachnospiraceae bacterium]